MEKDGEIFYGINPEGLGFYFCSTPCKNHKTRPLLKNIFSAFHSWLSTKNSLSLDGKIISSYSVEVNGGKIEGWLKEKMENLYFLLRYNGPNGINS